MSEFKEFTEVQESTEAVAPDPSPQTVPYDRDDGWGNEEDEQRFRDRRQLVDHYLGAIADSQIVHPNDRDDGWGPSTTAGK